MIAKYVERLMDTTESRCDEANAESEQLRIGPDARLLDRPRGASRTSGPGKIVLVVDDADRENEGDFIMAAEAATPEAVNFMVTHGRGIVCLPCAAWRLDELSIPQMVTETTDGHEAAFTVSIDFRHGTTTGTSAHDRAITARAVTDHRCASRATSRSPATCSRCARRRAVCCGAPVTRRRRWISPRWPACSRPGVICEVMNEDGTMARLPELVAGGAGARPQADLDRRHDRVPAPSRGPRGQGRRGHDPDPLRRVPLLRVREPRGRAHAHRPRDGRDRRRREGPHAGALGVPDGRRLRVAALRLR